MAVEVAAKANIFRRAGTRFVDYVKTLGGDYAAVSRGVFDESKARPIKAVIVTTALGGMGYALKTNPTELQLKDRLCILRQNLALLPLAIHSSRAGVFIRHYMTSPCPSLDNKLAELTHLISSGRLEYYDCWFFSLLVDRAWDKHVRLF